MAQKWKECNNAWNDVWRQRGFMEDGREEVDVGSTDGRAAGTKEDGTLLCRRYLRDAFFQCDQSVLYPVIMDNRG